MKNQKAVSSATDGRHSQYIEGLDGIRAVAVIAVIIFHADIDSFLRGGFLGVDVFFVLSGFLITSLIFCELKNTGSIDFKGFYASRARRLLPALLTVLFASAVYTTCFAPDATKALANDITPALLYYSNIWQLIDAQPYFEQFGRPHALQHLWSLAIEEQFYLIWPPLALLFFRLKKKISSTAVIGLLGIAATAWTWWLADYYSIPYENKPERLYFGTDTHAMGLLVGACLASFFRPENHKERPSQLVSDLSSVLALACLLIAFVVLDESSGFLYRGGFAVISILTALLIIGSSRHGSLANILLQHPLCLWVGKRSYSLYLWHWPVFVYFRPGDELPDSLTLSFLIRIILILALSDATYRIIEQPVRKSGWQAFGTYSKAAYAVSLAAIALAVSSLHIARDADILIPEAEYLAAKSETARPTTADEQETPPTDRIAFVSRSGEGPSFDFDSTEIRITAIGDSVMLGAKPVLYRKLPITHLDAEVGRQGSDLLKLLKKCVESKMLSETVLIHVGTNGYIYEQNLKQILEILQDRKQVVLINVRADRRWTSENNALLEKYRQIYKNITLIDWNSASQNHPEYFVKDGIHLSGKGMVAYAELARVALGVPDVLISHSLPASPVPGKKPAYRSVSDAIRPADENPSSREELNPDEANEAAADNA